MAELIKHILIIEDDEAIRTLLVDVLSEVEHYRLVTTSSAENALLLLEKTRFDLIILDLGLPRMGGNELLNKLKDEAITTPVIVSSANSQNLVATPQVKMVIPKPFDIDHFLDAVEQLIEPEIIPYIVIPKPSPVSGPNK